jgi:hypothetical protein
MKEFITGQIVLGGNELLLGLAPLGLCYDAVAFDLWDDPKFCPPERNALKDFFDAGKYKVVFSAKFVPISLIFSPSFIAKGLEWTNSAGWGDQFTDFCSWYGITCSNETSLPVHLDLGSNGLSGTISKTFGTLRSLEKIDLSDNNIKGTIPADIGGLSNLQSLRLSYNQFTSSIPTELVQLQNIERAHFQSNRLVPVLFYHFPLVQSLSLTQSNRLTGEISLGSRFMIGDSSFISDWYVRMNKFTLYHS